MSMEYIRSYYGVPAKKGGRVRLTWGHGRSYEGTITSAPDHRLRVRFDRNRRSVPVHPTWNLEYLDDEAVER